MKMDEETKFKDAVLRGAKVHLGIASENLSLKKLGIEIEFIDVSIDKQSIEIVGDKLEDKLIPVKKADVKPDAQLYVEPTIKVWGRNVIAPIILNISEEGNIEMNDFKAEIAIITPDDETNFKKMGPILERVFYAVIVYLIVEAIKFGIRFAISFLG